MPIETPTLGCATAAPTAPAARRNAMIFFMDLPKVDRDERTRFARVARTGFHRHNRALRTLTHMVTALRNERRCSRAKQDNSYTRPHVRGGANSRGSLFNEFADSEAAIQGGSSCRCSVMSSTACAR